MHLKGWIEFSRGAWREWPPLLWVVKPHVSLLVNTFWPVPDHLEKGGCSGEAFAFESCCLSPHSELQGTNWILFYINPFLFFLPPDRSCPSNEAWIRLKPQESLQAPWVISDTAGRCNKCTIYLLTRARMLCPWDQPYVHLLILSGV